ncbi:MAG: type II toxin-antitoxin system Phd/YefM family antitoxin [Nitrospirae bacterium]|nr:type II toxin-antitoxin system Phd/YefM family antitoxin [Nitrospirota bacterium]MBF0593310.1 type II toxin-antitoxin system Phd/YefM family antitoxin [Nitrospirota bacterium]
MSTLSEQFIIDSRGKRTGVILSIEDYKKILEELDELESIRIYDAAKASADEAISLDQAIREIEVQQE